MNSLNSILIEGNLTKDPVLKETPKGTSVCSFTVASNRFYRKDDDYEKEVSFIDVETWSKLAETCAGVLEKGRGVRVIGRIKQDRWNDTEGNYREKVKIVADHVEFRPKFKGKDEDTDEGTEESAAAEAAAQDEGSDSSREDAA